MYLRVLLLLLSLLALSQAFVPPTFRPSSAAATVPTSPTTPANIASVRQHSTALQLLLDVPDSFFTVTFIGSGLLLSVSKSFGRLRMEERAWEQRLEEGRRKRLEEDPTLTELELRRQEAALEWSAYGKPRMEEEAYRRRMEEEQELRRGGRNRVRVMEREDDEDEEDYMARQNCMTDEEIDRFEIEFGIDYDPYYDDPYTLEELPEGRRHVDKLYGDVIYEDGEIFYKDAETGLYYRQGARPRSMKFFS